MARKPVQRLAVQRMPRPKASEDLLGLLEDLHSRAIAGEVTSFAIATTNTRGECGSQYNLAHGGDGIITLLGELDCLSARVRDEIRSRNGGRI